MIHNTTSSYRQTSAWVLFLVFYLQLISPVLARIPAPRHRAGGGLMGRNVLSLAGSSSRGHEIYLATSAKSATKPERMEGLSNRSAAASISQEVALQQLQRTKRPKGKIGPTQPEMQSFQSVNANNMVDLFSGDFSYSVPLLDVGGYPVNLHYSSGITMDQEASWVGLGWNVNPGTINRNMRGLPDDFNGKDTIVKTFYMKPNKTVGLTLGASAELLGKTMSKPVVSGSGSEMDTSLVKSKPSRLGLTLGVFHNNYNGWGTETGINAGINAGRAAKGPMSGGLSITNNSQSGLDIAPSFSFNLYKEAEKSKGTITIGTNYNSRSGLQGLQLTMQIRQQQNLHRNEATNRVYLQAADVPLSGNLSFATPSFTPTISMPFTSYQSTFTLKLGAALWAYHPNFSVQGSFSRQYIAEKDQTQMMPAYGYLYLQEADNQPKALLDFNREKEVAYRGTSPHIAVPSYTHDIYSISGEGTGGTFRPYRGDVGMVYDPVMATKSQSGRASLDLGFGKDFQAGVDLNAVWASTRNNPWRQESVLARYVGFRQQDSLYEPVYFKNPGEKVTVDSDFYNKLGGDRLARVVLTPKVQQNSPVVIAAKSLALFSAAKQVGTVDINANTYKKQRDKRTQVISYLTAREAAVFGLDKTIRSFGINQFPSPACQTNYQTIDRMGDIRQPHHLSQIEVLGNDGRRYVYGVPAYNIEQRDVSFAVNKEDGNLTTGLVGYLPGIDNSPLNRKGKDNFYNAETVPAYAHSFLLSGIVSPNYVDITGDGITDDDNGDAVRFNYSRVYGGQNAYRWRAPFDEFKAAYNEGLKTYSRDDRGHYSYGQKEVWYLNSVESKTMIATFVLDTDSLRKDAHGVKGEDGGPSTQHKLYRLKQINLYTKADYFKNGPASAKPIKSVHFEYNYELCNGTPSANGGGKLTLKKVWFSYNKNYKGKLNPYVFTYHANEPFNSQANDRWGQYKNPVGNPGTVGNTLTNGEYPYTLQKGVNNWDSAKAAQYAAPWALKEIKLPSGGLMKVTYESDDYGYVQNRRAMRMFAIEGLGASPTATPQNALYQPGSDKNDYHYVFVRLAEAVQSKVEIEARYLEGVKKLYFKLWVKMPDAKDADRWGTGYEQVPCYADIEDYGIKTGGDNKTIWIKVATMKGSRSPMATAVMQYLRLNHPGKAYPYSEPGDNVGLRDFAGMIASVAQNIKNTIDGFEDQGRKKNWCNELDVAKTFVRLNQPDFKKLGGGLRVKKVEVFDNWNKMTGQTEANYGQTYDYSTTTLVNGQTLRISSGVATYEPAMGREENPFCQPISYAERVAAWAPVDYLFTEEPLGESFFPSASVGYSRVTVQTIHANKKSGNGQDVTEFYTARDFPTLFEHTPLDNESKKTFANPIGNFLRFDAKRYVTLSQGFRVELNDMHGKTKAHYSYAQTDLNNPISYTQQYYKLDNDQALLNRHLSNRVTIVDAANGVINTQAEMGKDVEMLIDVREQTSRTVSASLQLNLHVVMIGPGPAIFSTMPNLPTFEVNRYRSIAVMKLVNRYGILDSVVNFDKGSKVSTANMVYDGQTGNVLLARTQNEFDDPIYTFNYPAHWAYSGMGAASRNIGGLFKGVQFSNGRMLYKGMSPVELSRYFESGDELMLWGKVKPGPGNGLCGMESYIGLKDTGIKVWAIDASRASNGATGIFFIDKDGLPVNGYADQVKVLRSGHRNLLGVSVGSITSLHNPIQTVNGISRLVFDSSKQVIAAGAAVFKDVWKVDSSAYRKDTVVRRNLLLSEQCNYVAIKADRNFSVRRKSYNYFGNTSSVNYINEGQRGNFETYSQSFGCNNGHTENWVKNWLRFNLSSIPKGSVIANASLSLQAPLLTYPQLWERNGFYTSNAAYLSRTIGPWIEDLVSLNNSQFALGRYFNNLGGAEIDYVTRIPVNLTPAPTATSGPTSSTNPGIFTVTQMVKDMVDSYHNSQGLYKPGMVLEMQSWGACNWGGTNRMNFGYNQNTCRRHASYLPDACLPTLAICYLPPCKGNVAPVYSSTPVPGWYCQGEPVDTFICKPNINDTATNPYRWGIWGNWQTDRAYTYYGDRQQTDPSAPTTNIRKDGAIAGFMPYWSFTNQWLQPSQDSGRWVWNSEINLLNSKGLELQNHDPLDRYNAAQYGYNGHLPVAVGQNTRNRQMAFDGFEDYGYATDTCKSCPNNRFLKLVNEGALVDTVSHTGLYSLRVAGNTANSVTVPVAAADAPPLHIAMKIDEAKVQQTTVRGKGNGLNGTYEHKKKKKKTFFGWAGLAGFIAGQAFNNGGSMDGCGSRLDTTINFTEWGTGSPLPSCGNWANKIVWRGYIQPRFTELYRFHATADHRMSIWIGTRRITQNSAIQYTQGTYDLDTMSLVAGRLYPIVIELLRLDAGLNVPTNIAAVFRWSSPSEPMAVVPKSQLYTHTDTTGTTFRDSVRCIRAQSPKPSHVTHTGFSPLHGQLMVVGAWVREKGNRPDTVTGYRHSQVQVVFSNGATRTLKPTGNIIEGWQRIEDTLFIPNGVTSLQLRLMSTNSNVPVFFDDVRVHPFNSNIKSFVYNPVNIRLMAELDENNYASFYEYDDDGTLIRVKKETERGVKTIKETRSALLKE